MKFHSSGQVGRKAGSHPTWVRGLNTEKFKPKLTTDDVAPHVGAWIEIIYFVKSEFWGIVAPHVGAWIEISPKARPPQPCQSHPTWVRGLKFANKPLEPIFPNVAPHVGAWIEISKTP